VAMTRAIDRLVVCGAEGAYRPEGCWWNLVDTALRPLSVEEPADDGDGSVWRYRPTPPRASAAAPSTVVPMSADAPPPWLARAAPPEAPLPQPLSPSRAYDEAVAPARAPRRGGPAAGRVERERALARGVLTHRLLQSLPDIPPAARTDAARRHLARAATEFSAEEQADLIEQVLRVLDDPRFAQLFLPGSRAEIPIVGRLGGGAVAVAGQVDRIAIAGETVLIADYKTNRPAPPSLLEVPAAYIRQLALYRAVLAQLYPRKTIRAALIWTDVPDLMEIPAVALDRELAAVTSV
jgi:ATP-dependent helicase/nuclease subunit A